MSDINDERYQFFQDAGAAGEQLNDLEVSYWRDVRLYQSDDLMDLRNLWVADGSPPPVPPTP